MSDLINRQAAIEALGEKPLAWTEGEYELGLQNQWESDMEAIINLPSAQPEPCDLCKSYGIEDGDTLYISADWDGGIGFDYIRNIHYCPICGRRLANG